MLAHPSFGLVRTLDCGYDQGVQRIRSALSDQGFGVLTEIDLSATMKKKLDKQLRPYVILGACHPPSAWDALQAEPAVGLLLPCNVVVTVDDDDHAVVGAIDPEAMFTVVQAAGMQAVVDDVKKRLQAAIDAA
jgi:uncharacterized protein (DUF302 family)